MTLERKFDENFRLTTEGFLDGVLELDLNQYEMEPISRIMTYDTTPAHDSSASSASAMDDEESIFDSLFDDSELVPHVSASAFIPERRADDDEPIYFCHHLKNEQFFLDRLFEDTSDHERGELLSFFHKVKSSSEDLCQRSLHRIAHRTFGKNYLKHEGLSAAEIRNRRNLLDMKFYAIAARHLLITQNFSCSRSQMIEMFGGVMEQFPTCDVLDSEEEMELLFFFLAPVLAFENNGVNGTFYQRKSSLFVELGQFLEYSGRQYTSGGGKTASTKLREACLDLITGNVRATRKRLSKKAAKQQQQQQKAVRSKSGNVKATCKGKKAM